MQRISIVIRPYQSMVVSHIVFVKSVVFRKTPTIWLSKCHFAVRPDAVFTFLNTQLENHSFPLLIGLILPMQMLWYCKLLQEEETTKETLDMIFIIKMCKRLNSTSLLYHL